MSIDIDERKVNRNEAGLWLGWAAATAIGMALGFLPAPWLADLLGLGLATVISPLIAGLIIGLGQWLVLRGYLARCSQWILAAGAGWGIGYAIGILVLNLLPPGAWLQVLGYALFGLVVALVQWPILRREIPQVWPWVLANVIGWSLGYSLGQFLVAFLFDTLEVTPFLSTLISQAIAGFLAGAVIGLALVWIVRKPEVSALEGSAG